MKNFKAMPLAQKKMLYLRAKKAYYESDKPILTDEEFDRLEDLIKDEDPKWSGFKTGAPVGVKKTKKKLPIPMGSLDKIKKPEQVQRVLEAWEELVLSYKVDGASLELVYEGIPTQLYTRGNGQIGGDVSYLIPHLRGIPKKLGTKKRVIVRCEGIFTKAGFAKYRKEFDAPRNAASGILNRKDVHPATKDLQIVALQLLEPNVKPSDGLRWLKKSGFTVVPFKVVKAAQLNYNRLTRLLKKAKAESKYECDGLVLTRNTKNILPKSGNPDWGVAFKETVEVDEAPTTKILKTLWKVSPHGYLIPRYEVSPIKMSDGSTVRFAAAKNPRFATNMGLGPGAIVRLVKSGDIIPEIIGVEKKAKFILPDPKEHGSYHWDKNKVHLVLDDPKSNEEFRVQKIARTFGRLDIDFMRGATIKRLAEVGINSVSKILKATPEDFLTVPGFKDATANKLWTAIHTKIDAGFPIVKLADASGQFPRGIGDVQLQAVEERFNLMQLAQLPASQIEKKIRGISGIGPERATMIAKGLPKFAKWLQITKIKVVKPKQVKVRSLKLQGVNVTWTSYRNKDQEAIVQQNGGQVVSWSVKKTTVLLYSPTGKMSSKLTQAKEAGIPTLTWEQFTKKYGL
jgi:NAD-dependent DNA ligase